ncbi:MAG: hypothetical protein ACREMG_11765, partial [Gemmatimonadales bacterium]
MKNFERETSTEMTSRVPQVSNVEAGLGTLKAAAEDYTHGYTWTLKERIHAEVFDDYLEMARYLIRDEGLKD